MANKIKTTKAKPETADTLKQEKEESVEIKELLKDERTHKIAGSVCILLAILFFIAFTSYLFTWDEDQYGGTRSLRLRIPQKTLTMH